MLKHNDCFIEWTRGLFNLKPMPYPVLIFERYYIEFRFANFYNHPRFKNRSVNQLIKYFYKKSSENMFLEEHFNATLNKMFNDVKGSSIVSIQLPYNLNKTYAYVEFDDKYQFKKKLWKRNKIAKLKPRKEFYDNRLSWRY